MLPLWARAKPCLCARTRILFVLPFVAGKCFPRHGLPFPPSLPVLLAWSTLFRSHRTLTNYLGYVKTGCMLVGVSTEVISHSVTLLCCVGLYLRAGVQRACTEEGKGLG